MLSLAKVTQCQSDFERRLIQVTSTTVMSPSLVYAVFDEGVKKSNDCVYVLCTSKVHMIVYRVLLGLGTESLIPRYTELGTCRIPTEPYCSVLSVSYIPRLPAISGHTEQYRAVTVLPSIKKTIPSINVIVK